MPKYRPDPNDILKSVDEARKEVRYVIADFSVELIVSKFKEKPEDEGDIFVPDYQRSLAWTRDKMSYFVESLILRVPVPPIFFYDIDGRLEIVDGSQRVRTLVNFTKNTFALFGLGKVDVINGLKFADLPSSLQKRFNNTPIRSFVLDQSTDQTTRIDLFRRLNTSGKKLADAEIRRGAFRGRFLDIVLECASSDLFNQVLPDMAGGNDPDVERQELVTRFFIYSDYYKDFRHDVKRFLDLHMLRLNEDVDAENLLRMRREFDATMRFLRDNYPRAFYREENGRQVPRVRFEAIGVGANLALREKPELVAGTGDWLRSPQFTELVRTDASNSGPRLTGRIEFVRDRLLAGE